MPQEILNKDAIIAATSKYPNLYNVGKSVAASFPVFASIANYVSENITERKIKRLDVM